MLVKETKSFVYIQCLIFCFFFIFTSKRREKKIVALLHAAFKNCAVGFFYLDAVPANFEIFALLSKPGAGMLCIWISPACDRGLTKFQIELERHVSCSYFR